MKKLLVICVLAMCLSGCANAGQGLQSTGQAICAHETEARAALELATEKATLIVNPDAREAALVAIRVSLAALDTCPRGIAP